MAHETLAAGALPDAAECVAAGMRMALRLVRGGWPAMERTHLFFTVVGADLDKGMRQGRFARSMPTWR